MAEEDALLAARVQRARQAFDDPGNDDVLMVGAASGDRAGAAPAAD